MKRFFLAAALAFALTGCGTLIPKRVEFFQDKVHAFPESSAKQDELQRQAAQRANETAKATLEAALAYQAPASIYSSARETELLTGAVSASVGPPLSPSGEPSSELATELRSAIARLNRKIEDFKADNNENAGKKIEGTGLVSVPYFAWIGGIALVAFIGFHVLKLALSAAAVANPGAAVGLGVVNAGAHVVSKGFGQLVQGGETFKEWVEKEIGDSGVKEKILAAFQHAHTTSQDQDVQQVVQQITK